jgi:hypothetical protein
MQNITTQGLVLKLARIAEQIDWAAGTHNIEMREDEPLQEVCDELKYLATALFNTIKNEPSGDHK